MSRTASLVLCSCAVVAIAACNRNKSAAADTAASSQAQTPPAGAVAPPAQSLAQLAGTWHGNTLAKDRDTTIGTWTFQTSGDTGTVTGAGGMKVHVHDIHVVGDSIVEKMGPYKPSAKGQLITGDVAVQIRADSVHGTVVYRLAAKPDSVVSQVRIIGARTKP